MADVASLFSPFNYGNFITPFQICSFFLYLRLALMVWGSIILSGYRPVMVSAGACLTTWWFVSSNLLWFLVPLAL